MIGTLLIALAQAAAGAPQIAPSTAAPSPPATEQPAPQPAPDAKPVRARDQIVCHTEAMTGSRLGRRVCRTKGDEDTLADDSRKALEHMQGTHLPPGN